MTQQLPRRRAGILVPLFSMPSSRSWGIGEIGDIASMSHWLDAAGQQLLQLLPINELPPGESSPYSALSAMALDPQFITLDAVEDFSSSGGESSLDEAARATLDAVRATTRIDYAVVRALKQTALRSSFAHFCATEWRTGSRRASALQAFIGEQAWWLDDYSLFRALHAHFEERPWPEWPVPLRSRDRAALEVWREALAADILYRQYLQWIAAGQWTAARIDAGRVRLLGDLPFMVSGDSADVWARQGHFDLGGSVGVPPDAFSADGQDWGLPVYRWDVFAEHDFDWLRERARRNADLYDGYRVDHLVGFYRTYYRPREGGEPRFTPADQASQIALGERALAVFREPGAEVIAEDLGIIPDFVRGSLARLDVPGYKVFRWERSWHVDGQPFRDPAEYPAVAVATSGTHDTEPLAVWWDQVSQDERDAVLAVPSIRARLAASGVGDAILGALFASPATLVILPIQDVFGWRDRINQPATVRDDNWTWRLPWAVDRLSAESEANVVSRKLRTWATESRRSPDAGGPEGPPLRDPS
jgi:4-alpha-glucanotransferase